MGTDYNDKSSYLNKTQSVLSASKMLMRNLDAPQAKLEIATGQLETAALQHEIGGASYHTFMFSELEAPLGSDKSKIGRMAEDSLVSILADLDVANVLMAGGEARGEIGEEAHPDLLNKANMRLDNTIRAFESSLSAGRYGFTKEPSKTERIRSDNLQSAVDEFRSGSDSALSTLITEAKGAVTGAIDAITKLNIDMDSISSGISSLGSSLQSLPKVGRLFCLGIKKIEDAISSLIRMVGSDALSRMKDNVGKILGAAKDGMFADKLIEMVFGIQTTKSLIDEIMRSGDLDTDALDRASEELSQLKDRFKEKMETLKRITSAMAFGGIFISALAVPHAVLAIVSAHLIILASILLIGMDYADSGCILNQVRGVGEIAKGVEGRT